MDYYQPWDDSWQDQIVYIMIPKVLDLPVEMNPDFSYPVFLGAFEQKVRGDDFWKAVAGAMVYLLGHNPSHPQAQAYVFWLSNYNSEIVKELIYDGADQASKGNLDTAIWLSQAAILLEPERAEAHYNLGLAFYHMGIRIFEDTKGNVNQILVQAKESCFNQAVQYFENAVELDPHLSLAYYNLGFIYRELGRLHESEKYLEKSIMIGLDRIVQDNIEP